MKLISSDLKAELNLRKEKIQQMLRTQNADACLVSTNINLLYTTGKVINGYVYIPVEGDAFFFVRRPAGYEDENLAYIRKPEQIPDILCENGYPLPEVLMLEGDEITHGEWLRYEAIFTPKKTLNATALLRTVRSVKTDYEIDLLKKSAQIQSDIFRRVPSMYRAGMTDTELAAEFEKAMRLAGCVPQMRTFGEAMESGLCAVWTGENACAPSPYDFSLGGAGHPALPLGDAGVKIENGTSVMIDCGGNFTGYMSDQTRTFSVGKLPQKAYEAHQVAREMMDAIADFIKPGTVCEDVYHLALGIADRHGISEYLMGYAQQAKFIGHGIGLVVNELPVLCDRNKTLIEPNMVLAVEPKIVVPGVGAVGLENSFVVTSNGTEKITLTPEEIIAIEE
jgi:Xaa-Pro aminopeptidase